MSKFLASMIVFCAAALAACSVNSDDSNKPGSAKTHELATDSAAKINQTGDDANATPATELNAENGKTLFNSDELGCVNCHNIEGTGLGHGSIPLPGKQNSVTELRNKINEINPSPDHGRCSGDCANDVAHFIWETMNPQSKALKSLQFTTPAVSYQEAESLSGSTGYATNDAWLLNSTGFVSAVVDFPAPGHYQLAVRAWGDQGGNEPVSMSFNLDGLDVQHFDVKDTMVAPGLYISEVEIDNPGPQVLEIWFNNDLFLPAEGIDRNLYIDWLLVSGPNQVLALR